MAVEDSVVPNIDGGNTFTKTTGNELQFGDLAYTPTQSLYAGNANKEILSAAQNLDDRYTANRNSRDKLTLALANDKVDEKDQHIKQDAIAKMKSDFDQVQSSGRWEWASDAVRNSALDYAGNQGLNAARESLQGLQQQSADLQARTKLKPEDGDYLTPTDANLAVMEAKRNYKGVQPVVDSTTGQVIDYNGKYQVRPMPKSFNAVDYTNKFLENAKPSTTIGDAVKGADGKWYKQNYLQYPDGSHAWVVSDEQITGEHLLQIGRDALNANPDYQAWRDTRSELENPDDAIHGNINRTRLLAMKDYLTGNKDVPGLGYTKDQVDKMSPQQLYKTFAQERDILASVKPSAEKYAFENTKAMEGFETLAGKAAKDNDYIDRTFGETTGDAFPNPNDYPTSLDEHEQRTSTIDQQTSDLTKSIQAKQAIIDNKSLDGKPVSDPKSQLTAKQIQEVENQKTKLLNQKADLDNERNILNLAKDKAIQDARKELGEEKYQKFIGNQNNDVATKAFEPTLNNLIAKLKKTGDIANIGESGTVSDIKAYLLDLPNAIAQEPDFSKSEQIKEYSLQQAKDAGATSDEIKAYKKYIDDTYDNRKTTAEFKDKVDENIKTNATSTSFTPVITHLDVPYKDGKESGFSNILNKQYLDNKRGFSIYDTNTGKISTEDNPDGEHLHIYGITNDPIGTHGFLLAAKQDIKTGVDKNGKDIYGDSKTRYLIPNAPLSAKINLYAIDELRKGTLDKYTQGKGTPDYGTAYQSNTEFINKIQNDMIDRQVAQFQNYPEKEGTATPISVLIPSPPDASGRKQEPIQVPITRKVGKSNFDVTYDVNYGGRTLPFNSLPEAVNYLKLRSSANVGSAPNPEGKTIPQRNNNPYDIKGTFYGKVIGTDAFGHAQFANTQDGIDAGKQLISAIYSGKDKNYPAGKDTKLEDFASTYAENPKYIDSIVKILGVPKTTKISDIPEKKFSNAVAQLEDGDYHAKIKPLIDEQYPK